MGLKDIKLRMQAIKKTASITQAMHNIALSKIRRSTDLLNQSKSFMDKIEHAIMYADKNLDEANRLTSKNEGKHKLFILITSDRGLAGSYHNQLFKGFLADIKDLNAKDYQVFVIGKKGFYFAKKHKLPMVNEDIIYNRDDISTMYFRHYATLIKDLFIKKFVDEVIIYHNHYINTATQEVFSERILPLIFDEQETHNDQYIYDESPEVVLDKIMNVYVESKIFEGIADAKLSEHASRMVAMKNATDNANEIVDQLAIVYHRERQREITNEIIDVVNGANV
ncbi:MAG: ATP synthase F1 subunit gamma [Acholeplasmataceae bacterium]|nr:ATP synthase F1 subunit gamma [Acholeplasmataceae bacterium]